MRETSREVRLGGQRGRDRGRGRDHFNPIITFILRGVITQSLIRILPFLRLTGGPRGLKSRATEMLQSSTQTNSCVYTLGELWTSEPGIFVGWHN